VAAVALPSLSAMLAGPADPMPAGAAGSDETEKIFLLVLELTNPEQRESALLELSKRRETFADLAPILWHSFGTISALLQEIVTIYPLLSPPSLTAQRRIACATRSRCCSAWRRTPTRARSS